MHVVLCSQGQECMLKNMDFSHSEKSVKETQKTGIGYCYKKHD